MLLLRLRAFGLSIARAHAAELRLQHAGRESAHVRNELGIFGRPFHLKRDRRAARTFASIQNAADSGKSRARTAARSTSNASEQTAKCARSAALRSLARATLWILRTRLRIGRTRCV